MKSNKMLQENPLRKVMDAATRTWHWMFAACFVGAYLTAESETFRLFHVTLGYTLAGLLAFRLIWGVVGPRHVRLSAMFRKLKGWVSLKEAFQNGQVTRAANIKLAVNLMMTVVVISMLLAVIPITLSGYTLFNDLVGDWMEKVHEFLGEFMLWLVLMHLGLIVLASLLRKTNLASGMWTGYQSGAGPDLIKHDHNMIAWALVVSSLSWALYYLFVVH